MIKKLLFFASLTFIFFASCTKDDSYLGSQDPKIDHSTPFRKLENPYSVKNMRKALALLEPQTRADLVPFNPDKLITTTDLYVVYKPKTRDELDELLMDTTIHFYPFPLDCEFAEGVVYREPGLSDSLPDYYYCASPIDRPLNLGVESTVLEKLFIPDETAGGMVTRSGVKMSKELIAALVEKSMEITGNASPQTAETRAKGSWKPAGTITALDDLAGTIPLKSVKVRARRWFTTHQMYTNYNGYYSSNKSFERDANYCIIWESYRWDIRDGWIKQAYYNGPKKTGNWNLYISGGKSLRFATIHRAAYRYYFDLVDGFLRPANQRKEKICYMDKEGTGVYWGNIGAGVLPDIKIFGIENGKDKKTYKIYRTTIHELAHAAHCTCLSKIQYWQVEKVIYESWADFAEYAITMMEYKSLRVGASELLYLEEKMNSQESWPVEQKVKYMAYSPLFIDLVDTYNQGASNDKLPFDEVSGFSNSVLNLLLLDSYGLTSLKTNVKLRKPYNVTNAQIDKLFEKYETAKYK